MKKEIAFTNWIRVGDRREAFNELTKVQQEQIAKHLTCRPLATIANAEVVRSS